MHPSEEIVDVILGQHHLFDPGEALRLLLPHPQELRGRKTSKGDVGRPGGEAVCAHRLIQIGDLLCRPAIVPQDGRANDPVLVVQDHQTMHLTADANAGHLAPVKALQKEGNPLPHGPPPVLRVLLAPARFGKFQGICFGAHIQNLPRLIHQQQLHRGSAQINSNV